MTSGLPITLATASILGLMFVWLSARVISARVRAQALIGDQDDEGLLFAIRTHGNFTEYVPLFLIILGLLESAQANRTLLLALAGLFVVARLLHVPGMGVGANLKLRQAGIAGSFIALVSASLYGLYLVAL